MTNVESRTAAARFAADWQGRGDEKQETQRFWIELLTKGTSEETAPFEAVKGKGANGRGNPGYWGGILSILAYP